MVANYTIGKKGYEHNDQRVQALMGSLIDLQNEFESLANEDALAFQAVMKNEPKASEWAASVPQKVIQKSKKGMFVLSELLELGNKHLISDIGVGAACLQAAISGSKINILVNGLQIDEAMDTEI